MATNTLATGTRARDKATESSSFPTTRLTQVVSKTTSSTEKVLLSLLTAALTKAPLPRASGKAKVSSFGRMAKSTMEIGNKASMKAKGYSLGLTARNTKGNSNRERGMERALSIALMAPFTKANGN